MCCLFNLNGLSKACFVRENEQTAKMNKTKLCNGFYIKFRQSFAKETLSYDRYSES